ncbi:MAG: hypothetical protein JXO51_05620 [Candidatus Aminicenantes bacterium]|nr:hypothetical protein [Candidatus Aminicenantes bacterium]
MQKQKAFFFAARAEMDDTLAAPLDLRRTAENYVRLYGESCLSDPETPAFVRRLLARTSSADMPQAG